MPENITVSPSTGLALAGGETITVSLSAPLGSSTLGIDSTKLPVVTIGNATAASCSVNDYTGGTATAADTVEV